jgi:hypothetical protein
MGRLREPDTSEGDGFEAPEFPGFFLNFGNRGVWTVELDEAVAVDGAVAVDRAVAVDEAVALDEAIVPNETAVPDKIAAPESDEEDFRDRCDS